MKPQMLSLLTVALVAAASIPAHAQGNIILNGSFEQPTVGSNGGSLFTTPTEWIQSGGPNSGFFNPSLYNAHQSATIFLPPTDGEQVEALYAGSSIFQLGVTTTPGRSYRLTFDLSRDVRSTQSSLLQVEIQGYPQILNAYFTIGGDSTSWVHESYDFIPTDALGRYTVSFWAVNGDATVLDNVVIQQVPEPNGALLFGFSVLGMLVGRFRWRGGVRVSDSSAG